MTRAQVADVRAVIETDLEADVISSFIRDAALEVDERLPSGELSEARLLKIEKYLAAHLIRFTRDRQEESYGVGNVSTTYTGAFGEGLAATSPGQVVIETDTTGTFDGNPGGPSSPSYVRKVHPGDSK